MKLPKLPKLPKLSKLPKLPKLPKIAALSAIPNPFKKKSDDDGLDDDFDAIAAAADGDPGGTPPLPADAGEGGEEEGEDLPIPLPERVPDESEAADAGASDAAAPEAGGPDSEAVPGAGPEAADIEIPDFGDDFDDDDEDSDQEKRKKLIVAAAGAAVVALGVIGGASWWFLGDSDAEPAAAGRGGDKDKGARVAMALPAKPGSLNAQVAGGGLNQLAGAAPGEPQPSAAQPGAAMPPGQAPGQAAGQAPDQAAGQAPGQSSGGAAAGSSSTLARAAGDIGGRFGGRADPLGGSLNAIGGTQEKGTGIVIPSVTSVTLRSLPDHPGGRPLGPTPDARLVEKKEGLAGTLPIIGKDGELPWQIYARTHDAEVDEDAPQVAIVILGLGMSRASTMAAISKLPPQVTLALDPYADDLSDWLVRARLVGHEVMVMLPMESERFPVRDAGPFSLDTGLKDEDNIARLENVLSRVSGYIGVVPVMGSRFGTSEKMMRPIIEVLNARGLMLLVAGAHSELAAPKIAAKLGMARAISDITLDGVPTAAAIDAKLAELEEIIEIQTRAIAVAHPYPATFARLIEWTKKLEGRKIALVPVSTLVDTSQPKSE